MVTIGLSRDKDVLKSVRTAVELAGGLGIKEGDTVLIRPNANTADPAPGSTSPEVLRGAIREVKRYNPGKIIVAEKSMTTLDTEKVLKKLGLWQVAEGEGVDEILTFDHLKREHVEPEKAYSWPFGFDVPEFLGSVDYTIALPVIKTHWTLYIMGLKSHNKSTPATKTEATPQRTCMICFWEISLRTNPSFTPYLYIDAQMLSRRSQ